MGKPIREVYKYLGKLAQDIRYAESISTYNEYLDCSGVEFDYKNPDELQLWDKLQVIMEHLNAARFDMQYLNAPVRYESRLYLNSRGRYADENGEYYTCGNRIEYYDVGNPEYDERPRWRISRVEHNQTDYYIVDNPDLPMNGLLTRVREKF